MCVCACVNQPYNFYEEQRRNVIGISGFSTRFTGKFTWLFYCLLFSFSGRRCSENLPNTFLIFGKAQTQKHAYSKLTHTRNNFPTIRLSETANERALERIICWKMLLALCFPDWKIDEKFFFALTYPRFPLWLPTKIICILNYGGFISASP